MERTRPNPERSEADHVPRTGDTTKFRAAVLLAAMNINEAQAVTARNEKEVVLEELYQIELSKIEIERAYRKVSLENARNRRVALDKLSDINQLLFSLME